MKRRSRSLAGESVVEPTCAKRPRSGFGLLLATVLPLAAPSCLDPRPEVDPVLEGDQAPPVQPGDRPPGDPTAGQGAEGAAGSGNGSLDVPVDLENGGGGGDADAGDAAASPGSPAVDAGAPPAVVDAAVSN